MGTFSFIYDVSDSGTCERLVLYTSSVI